MTDTSTIPIDFVAALADQLVILPGGDTAREHTDRFRAAIADAHHKWPEAPDPDASFVRYVVERAQTQPDLATALARLRLDDLVLAWWASTGASPAIAAFERAHADELRRLLQRFHRLDADELRQQLRVKLFLGGDSVPPRILEFSGFGWLHNWFRVVATRTFLDAARSKQRERSDDLPDAMLEALVDAKATPRLAAVRAQVIAAIRGSLAKALASLPPRERTFLRHALIDRLTLEQIAETYGVHRVTVSRVIGAARTKLRELALEHAVETLGISPESVASAVRDLESQLDMSLATLFPD